MDDKPLRNRSGRIAAIAILAFAGMWQMAYSTDWYGTVFETYEDVMAESPSGGDMPLAGPPQLIRRVTTSDYDGYVMPDNMQYFPLNMWWYPAGNWNMSDEDVAFLEAIIRDKLPEFCMAKWAIVPEVFSDMKRYIRQYFGFIIIGGESKGQRIAEVNLVNGKAYREIERKHPEYFTECPYSDRVRINEMFMYKRLEDEFSLDWNELFTISMYINVTGRYIEYVGYHGYPELGYRRFYEP